MLQAEDGEKGIQVIEEQGKEIDLVLLDWNLPGMDGLDVLKWIRSNEQSTKLPVIMVTAMGHQEKIRDAINAGVTNYISKPFDPEDLADRINNCLER